MLWLLLSLGSSKLREHCLKSARLLLRHLLLSPAKLREQTFKSLRCLRALLLLYLSCCCCCLLLLELPLLLSRCILFGFLARCLLGLFFGRQSRLLLSFFCKTPLLLCRLSSKL